VGKKVLMEVVVECDGVKDDKNRR